MNNFTKNLSNKIFELDFQFFSEGGGIPVMLNFAKKNSGGGISKIFELRGGVFLAIPPPW